MTRVTFAVVIAALVLLVENTPLEAAETYHISTSIEGVYATHHEGAVVIDGKRWRINYDTIPGDVTSINAIIGTADGDVIAINDSNHTWFRVRSRAPLWIGSRLFSFGNPARISKIRVVEAPAELKRGPAAGATNRITFSYRINTKVSSEDVQGEVWGEIRIWATAGPERAELPWKAFELRTGFDSVDEALRVPLAGVRGFVWQSETEVSRRIENGETLKQVIRRNIGPLTTIVALPQQFAVPAGYVYQEPVVGAP